MSATGLSPVAWPTVLTCNDCGRWGARVYPYPRLEDAGDFLNQDELRWPTVGTIWCQFCSPWWGEFLLQQMSLRALRVRPDGHQPQPTLPLLGGYPAEAIGFLESELADFLDGPGPLTSIDGSDPAPRGLWFWFACADLVAFMRDAGLTGHVTFAPMAVAS